MKLFFYNGHFSYFKKGFVKFVYLEKMSKIANYNDISQSYDSAREAADACILKSLMESVTGKCVKVIQT